VLQFCGQGHERPDLARKRFFFLTTWAKISY